MVVDTNYLLLLVDRKKSALDVTKCPKLIAIMCLPFSPDTNLHGRLMRMMRRLGDIRLLDVEGVQCRRVIRTQCIQRVGVTNAQCL